MANKNSRVALLLLSLIAASSVARAQQPACSPAPADLPEVRGLKLGMSVQQLKVRFPHFKPPKPDAYGYAEFDYDFTLQRGAYESYGEETKEPFDGIDTNGLAYVGLSFLDDKVVSLAVAYARNIHWRDLNEFLGALTGPLKLLPPDRWKMINKDSAEYRCGSYLIRATTAPKHGGSGIAFYSEGVVEEIQKRKAAEEERRRRTFKP
jgi:hypothetical protein